MRTIAFCALFNVTQPASGKDCRENTGESDAKTQIPENIQTLVVRGASTPHAPLESADTPPLSTLFLGNRTVLGCCYPSWGSYAQDAPNQQVPVIIELHRRQKVQEDAERIQYFQMHYPVTRLHMTMYLRWMCVGLSKTVYAHCSLYQMALPRSPQSKPHQQSTTGAHSCHRASNSFPSRF